MSRSSEFYQRVKAARSIKILKFNEADEFLDFNEFGPDADAQGNDKVTMTLDEFVNLPIFTIANLQKAVLCLKNHETCEFENEEESVEMSSEDDETAHVKYGDIELDFDKDDLLNAFQERLDVEQVDEVVESVQIEETEEKEMPSVLKFKDFMELEKFEAKQDGKDSF
jgi:hypothetical protein